MIKLKSIITFIIDLSFIFYILYWLYYLNNIKCNCALNEKRKQIIFVWYLILFLIFILFIILGNNRIILPIIAFFSIFNSYYTYEYIKDLDKNKCHCSNSIHRKIIYYYSISTLSLSIILFFAMLFIIFYYK